MAASKKKRKPSFRPTGNRKSKEKAADDGAAGPEALSEDTKEEGEQTEQEAPEDSTIQNNDQHADSVVKDPLEASASTPRIVGTASGKKGKGRTRKRKTTVLAIGSSRQQASSSSTALVTVPENHSEFESASTALADAASAPGGLTNQSLSPNNSENAAAAAAVNTNQASQPKSHMPLERFTWSIHSFWATRCRSSNGSSNRLHLGLIRYRGADTR